MQVNVFRSKFGLKTCVHLVDILWVSISNTTSNSPSPRHNRIPYVLFYTTSLLITVAGEMPPANFLGITCPTHWKCGPWGDFTMWTLIRSVWTVVLWLLDLWNTEMDPIRKRVIVFRSLEVLNYLKTWVDKFRLDKYEVAMFPVASTRTKRDQLDPN